jgi:hypothetical protein
MRTILFLKAVDRRDTSTVDMFAAPSQTHVETHTRKDGVVQKYHVAAPVVSAPPKTRKPLTAIQQHEMKLENTLRRYQGEAELTEEEFLEQQDAIKKRAKAAKLRADAKRIAESAHNDLSGIVAGQPVMTTRDRNKRDKAGDKMRRASELLQQAEELSAPPAVQAPAAPAKPAKKKLTLFSDKIGKLADASSGR